MAEYIKRADAMIICERYSTHCFEASDSRGQDIADRILDDVVEIPTADVKEVKHGYWEDLYKGKYDNPLYTCSECYCRALRKVEADCLGHEIIRQELSPYCPHCGAKMDGRSDT